MASQSLPQASDRRVHARPIFGYLLLRHARLPRRAGYSSLEPTVCSENTGIGGKCKLCWER